MLSIQQINKEIRDYEQNTIQDSDIRLAKIDILYWLLKHNTEEEINNKIKRLQEELIFISDTNDKKYRCNMAKINELQKIL